MEKKLIINKEISWLSFNERVLQEANDENIPLIQRFKFLGIFSSNMDEFYRVRVATLQNLSKIGKKAINYIGDEPKSILKKIQTIVLAQNRKFDATYNSILNELGKKNIYIINEKELDENQAEYVKSYFHNEVHSKLFPILISFTKELPQLKDKSIYLAVNLSFNDKNKKSKYALIEIPTMTLPRFVILPRKDDKKYIILLDDVIRFNLKDIFSMFEFDTLEAFTIKLTRNAELDIDNDFSESFIKKMARSIKKRSTGIPVRFVYDSSITEELLSFIQKKLKITKEDALIPGGRYHNFKDFINFPDIIEDENSEYDNFTSLKHRDFNEKKSLLSVIKQCDVLLYVPYHSFESFIDLLREASMDPKVESIKITIYRVAKNSGVLNALINAVRNGKKVLVVIELQARFDEEANINWANRLREEGAQVTYGINGLKVHSKLCLITRNDKKSKEYYAVIGTGNFNENTAKTYTDHFLFTSDRRITNDVNRIFDFFESTYKNKNFKHLIISPFESRERIYKLIHNEIKNAKEGKEAGIILKLNSLVDSKIINKLYKASQSGVKIKLIVRGMFSLIPGIEATSENIESISIIDKFLEHTRILIFHNNGNEKVFISSADFMERNFDKRVEVICPIYDKKIIKELKQIINIQLQDNVKARVLNKDLDNEFKIMESNEKIRSQFKIYELMKNLNGLEKDKKDLKCELVY